VRRADPHEEPEVPDAEDRLAASGDSQGRFVGTRPAAGGDDAQYIGDLALSAGVPGTLSNAALVQAAQAMIDGEGQNFLFRRADTGFQTIWLTAVLTGEFDVN
jgi:hypothetical protein